MTKQVNGFSEVDEGEVGAWSYNEDSTHVIIRLPEPAGLVCLPINGERGWKFSQDGDKITFNPSIFVDPPTGWHGWVINGEITKA